MGIDLLCLPCSPWQLELVGCSAADVRQWSQGKGDLGAKEVTLQMRTGEQPLATRSCASTVVADTLQSGSMSISGSSAAQQQRSLQRLPNSNGNGH